MPVLPIPDDWDGQTWGCYIIEWPKSVTWESYLFGFVTSPMRGRLWDPRSGSIKDAQDVGKEIKERNDVMSCEAIVTALQEIRDKIESISIDQTTQVDIQNDISASASAQASAISSLNAIMLSVAQASSSSSAWATSFAQASAPVKIINNVSLEIRPLDPVEADPPSVSEQAETGITDAPADDTSSEVCKRAFWVIYTLRTMFEYWAGASLIYQTSVLGFLAALATGLSVAALKGDPAQKAILIPASVLLQAAHLLTELYYGSLVEPCIVDIRDWLQDDFGEIVCILANGAEGGDSTLVIQQAILAAYLDYSSSPFVNKYVNFLALLVNLNTLALMYYASSIVTTFDAIPPEFGGASLCSGCGSPG